MAVITKNCVPAGPRGHIQAAEANNSTSTVDFLTELFDNSIDAGAKTISAKVAAGGGRAGRGSFHITDDGSGVQSIEVLMQFGGSSKEASEESIGRYGVGAKDCIWTVGGLSSTLNIQSRTRTASWRASIAWESQRDWQFAQDEVPPDDLALTTQTGLRLSMERCNRKMPTARELRDHIARAHWPWLEKRGREITINGERVAPPEKPKTDERFVRGTEVRVDEDRWFTMEGGVLKEGHPLNGVTVFSGNRAICVADAIGTGDYSRSGIFVLVRLHGAWSLERNKKGLTERDADDLCSALEGLLQPTLAEASERMRYLDDGAMLDRINDVFAGVQGGRIGKPRRPGSGNGDKGDKTPRGTDRKVVEAGVVDGDGDATERRARRKSKPYQIDFVVGEEDLIGSVDGSQRVISLFKNNPSVAAVKSRQDDEAVMFFAAALLANHRCQERKKAGQFDYAEAFGVLVAAILKNGSTEAAT